MHKKKLWWGKTGEYTPLKWIQGDGRTQYIRFDGIFPKADDAIEVVVEAKEFGAGGYAHVYGAGNATNNANAVNCLILPSGGNGGRFLGKTYSGFSGALDTKYVIYEDGTTQTYNGTKQTDTGEASGQADTNPLTLFRHGATPSDSSQLRVICGVLRISALRMWNKTTGKMILDVVPVLDKEGVPCFWDRVENKLYYNKGTGDFTYEEWDFTPCDYVYADGNAYLNSLWYGDENTATEVYFKADDLTYRIAVGSRSSATENNISTFINSNENLLVQDFGNYRNTRQSAALTDGTNWVRVYNSKDERWVEEDGQSRITTTTQFTETFTTPTPIYFGYARAGSYQSSCSNFKGNYKESKIYENGVLVRDLIPAIDGDNKGCFYDKTLNTLFYSLGSSDFVGHLEKDGVDYKVVKYLESTGTQYIDTGITGNNPNLKIEVDATTYEFGWCHQNNGSGVWVDAFSFPSDNKERVNYGNYALVKDFDYDRITRKIRSFDFQTGFYIDGVLIQEFTIANYSSLTPSLPLFARYDFNSSSYTILANSSDKIFGCKIYDNNKLVRNFLPALRKSDNELGMFDTVSRQFYGNNGTGTFNYEEA